MMPQCHSSKAGSLPAAFPEQRSSHSTAATTSSCRAIPPGQVSSARYAVFFVRTYGRLGHSERGAAAGREVERDPFERICTEMFPERFGAPKRLTSSPGGPGLVPLCLFGEGRWGGLACPLPHGGPAQSPCG